MAVPDPAEYDVHPVFGFVPEIRAENLPSYFEPWMTLAENLSDSKTIRHRVSQLPLLDHTQLEDDPPTLRLAHNILTAIVTVFVFADLPEGVPEVLPRQLAIPLKGVSDRLGLPPHTVYYTVALTNWRLKDPHGPFVRENMECLVTMTHDKKQESWFFNTSVEIEIVAAEGVMAVIEAQKSVLQGSIDDVTTQLAQLERCVKNIVRLVSTIRDGCAPSYFFATMGPYLMNSWDSELFQKKNLNGLVFEGVSDKPFTSVVANAAQTCAIPVFDAALGIVREEKLGEALRLLDHTRPPRHVQFIRAIENGPSIKEFVLQSDDRACLEIFNRCAQALTDFRSHHIRTVTSYVFIPSSKSKDPAEVTEETRAQAKGVRDFLKAMRDGTRPAAS